VAEKKTLNPKQYKVRNHLKEVLGTASEKDILRRIAKGKLTGDEEVSQAPFTRWRKLSSHPLFYDAFLKRLYESNYVPPDEPAGTCATSASKVKKKDKATRLEAAGKTEHVDPEVAAAAAAAAEDLGKTRQVAGEALGVNETLHQSAIDELFSEVSDPPPKPNLSAESLEPPAIGTDIIKLDNEPVAESGLYKRLDIGESVTEEESSEVVARKRKREQRRRLIWVGVLTLLLMLLFQMGNSPSSDKNANKVAESDSLKPALRQLLADSTPKEEKVRTLIEEGDRLYENDTPLFYLGAQELFNEALTVDESSPAVLGRLAEATARLLPEGSKEDSLDEQVAEWVKRGRSSDPQYSQFYRAEALVALYSGKLENAQRFISDASESDPTNPENLLVQGEVLFRSGDRASKAIFEDVLKTHPGTIRAHYYLGRLALDRQDYGAAQKAALSALVLNPLHASSYVTLGRVAAAQNKLKDAKQLYATSVALAQFGSREDVSAAYYQLGLLSEGEGDAASAKKNYQLAVYYARETSADLKKKTEGLDTSEATLRDLAAKSEYSVTYFSEQGENLVNQNKGKEALVFFHAASLLKPNDGSLLVRIGEVTEKIASSYDDFRTVVSYYQRAIERQPKLTRAYIKLGLLETEQYNLERAYRLLKQAEALSPQEADPYVALGKYFYKSKDYFAAIEQFTKAFKINPADSEILYYAGLLRMLGKKDVEQRDALNFFYQAYIRNPLNYDALVEWLKLKVLAFEKTFAIKFVRNLLENEPRNSNLYWALGEIYAANKEYRRSVEFYHKALDLDNKSSRVRMALGRSLEAVGELDRAVAEYRLASFLDRRNSDGFYKAADLHFQMKQYTEAEEVLKFLISVCPSYPGAHRYLSKLYQRKNRKDDAVAEMLKEVANNPLNAKFRVELAELYMDYQKFELAVTELTEVTNLPPVSKAPEFAYEKIRAYLLLSRCYRAMSKYESAEGTIRLALETDPDDPELHRELGYVYHALQRDKESVRAFEFYLNRNPAARDAEAIKGMIQNMVIDE